MPFSSPRYDDNAIKIGNALLRSKLSSLDINLTGLTPRGASALANGIAAASPRLTAISVQGQAPTLHHETVLQLLFQGLALNPFTTTLNLVACLTSTRGLCDVLSSSLTKLQCLKLWTSATCQLQPPDMHLLGEAMTNNTSLQEVWLGMSHDPQESPLFDTTFFSCLARRSLRLTKLHVRGERNPTVTTRARMSDHPDDDGDDEEEEEIQRIPLLLAMQPLLRSTQAPREVELQNCPFPEGDWAYLAESLLTSTVASLTITNCILTLTSIQHLSRGLCCCPTTHHHSTLQTLRLCRNQLGDAGLQVLLSNGLLRHNKSLTTLALVNNQISDVGMSYLAEHLEQRSVVTTTTLPPPPQHQGQQHHHELALQHLDLMHNLIGPNGARILFETAAVHLLSLQTLSLAENVNMGIDGISQLGAIALARLHVRSLDLSWRTTPSWQPPPPQQQQQQQQVPSAPTGETTEAVPSQLESCARREAAGQALVRGLSANYYLQELLIPEQEFSLPIRKQIAFYTHLNQCGRRGLLTQCTKQAQSEAIWSRVLAKCANDNGTTSNSSSNNSVLFYFLQQKPELIAGASSGSMR